MFRIFQFLTIVSAAIAVGFLPSSVTAQTYTWSEPGGGNLNTDTHWTPPRSSPLATDTLVFDGAVQNNLLITNLTGTMSAGRLLFVNNVVTTFTATGPATLTVNDGTTATDLLIEAGSSLDLTNNQSICIQLSSGATGDVWGDVTFRATEASIIHRIVSQTAGGLAFKSGATAAMAPNAGGALGGFGSTAAPAAVNGGTVFESGATYYQGGDKHGYNYGGTGSNPFSLTAPSSAVVFNSGSTYVAWSGIPATSGRTYGNFVWRGITMASMGGASACIIQNDLVVMPGSGSGGSAANCSFGSQTGPLTVQGNVLVSPSGPNLVLSASPGSPTAVIVQGQCNIPAGKFVASTSANLVYSFTGATTQTLSFGGTAVRHLTLSNAVGIVLAADVNVLDSISLNTAVHTGANVLTLGTSGATPGNLTGAGTIAGAFRRWFPTSTGARTYPLVDAAGTSRRVIVDYTGAPAAAGRLLVRFVAGAPGTSGLPLNDGVSLENIGEQGVWEAVADSGLSGGTYSLTMNATGFGPLTSGGDPTGQNVRIVKRADSVSAWTLDGAAGANTLPDIVRTGLSGFSEFGLAAPLGQLPVDLSAYSAE